MNRLVLAMFALSGLTAHAAIPASERTALLNLYNSTNGDAWISHTGWNGASGTECTWQGVMCIGDHVTALLFFGNKLTGSLPSLAALTELKTVELASNQISGSIPPFNGLLNLSFIDLGRNQFSGSIPSLTGLTNLSTLDLSANQLTGTIPPLTGLASLTTVSLYYNYLSGEIPSLSALTNLTDLDLQFNLLTGPIPSFAGLSKLQTVILDHNELTGAIPSLSGLTNLRQFDLSDNQLSGSAPSLDGLLIQYIHLDFNRLTGALPPAPPSLVASGSSLCPNFLTPTPDPAWDAATARTPWSLACATIPPPPAIDKVTRLFSPSNTIQSGAWFSIYGTNLAPYIAFRTTNFPASLGQTSVTINGKPGYMSYVSPTQVNLQAPDDTVPGPVEVKVTTVSGSAVSTVSLAQVAPSFNLLDSSHVAAIIIRDDGSGTKGAGTYDIVGPTGSSLGYRTVAAKAGDTLEFFGAGFGPTTPFVQAGRNFTGAAPTQYPVAFLISGQTIPADWAGMSAAGQFQLNLKIPAGLGTGDVPILATVNGVTTQAGVVLALQ